MSQSFPFRVSCTMLVVTGLAVLQTSHTFTVRQSRLMMYLEFGEKIAELYPEIISVRKFF